MTTGTQRRIRHKIFEWLRRYAPNEIAGWVGQLGAAAATYALTGSYAAAVIAATIGASAGYYAAAYFNAVRWSYRAQAGRSWPTRVLVANGLAARSIAVEFGPGDRQRHHQTNRALPWPVGRGEYGGGLCPGQHRRRHCLLRDDHLQLRALHQTASATSTRKCACMTSNHWKGNVMSSISPLMARIFDDPHASHRRRENHSKRSRLESKGRVSRSKRS